MPAARSPPGAPGPPAVGTRVPNFDVYGHLHHKTPFKDSQNKVKPVDRWMKEPRFKTRTEMMEARHAAKIPHISYDFDGDGVVGQRDYFIGKHFDVGQKDYLTKKERDLCTQTMPNGFNFSWGHDRQGVNRPFTVQQRRGIILSADNPGDVQLTYPPHHNADNVPLHRTLSDLTLDRKKYLVRSAHDLKRKWDAQNPHLIEEPDPPTEWKNPNPTITHISERAEHDHAQQRIKSGLYPVTSYVNPEREHMMPGLGYETCPEFRTRGQLLGMRKELMNQDLVGQRRRNEQIDIPRSVRKLEEEEENHIFRGGARHTGPTFTKTLMEHQRKRDRMYYDLKHFGEKGRNFPKYCDQDAPWWTLVPQPATKMFRSQSEPHRNPQAEGGSRAGPNVNAADHPMNLEAWGAQQTLGPGDPPRCHAQAGGRVLSVPREVPTTEDPRNPGAILADVHQSIDADPCYKLNSGRVRGKILEKHVVAEKTKYRWSDLIVVNGGGQGNNPRLFDNLGKIPTQTSDHLPMDRLSSFELIRKGALRSQAKMKSFTNNPDNPFPKSSLHNNSEVNNMMNEKAKSVISGVPDHNSKMDSTFHSGFSIDPNNCNKSRSLNSRQRNRDGGTQSVIDQTINYKTTMRENPRGADLSMMDRTLKGFSATIRSGGFQRADK